MSETPDPWDPHQYNRFAAEREQPFWDLAALLDDVDGPIVVDLGCGDGRLTAQLHDELGAQSTRGIDSSRAMLDAAHEYERDGLTFELGDIGEFNESATCDLVFANASLQWVPNHTKVLRRWRRALRDGGQLAVQVPANADHATHVIAAEVAAEFLTEPPPDTVAANVLAPETYATILNDLGADEQLVRLQVYAHSLDSTADLVEWTKGTTLTRFREPLGERYDEFVAAYAERLIGVLGEQSPFFYPFKRILLWARF